MINKVAIVGSGALGLYYGGRIALTGKEVTFLARGDVAALQRDGMTISWPGERHTLAPVRVVESAEAIGPVDLVIIGLKATANPVLPQLLPPLLGPGTMVLNLQNGLGVDEQVAAVVGVARTLGGLCFVGVNRVAPGVAVCSQEGYVALGEYAGGLTAQAEAVGNVFRAAGVKVQLAESLLAARWRKLVWNVPFNGLAVIHGLMSDEVLRDALREARVRALMREVQAIASAEGVEIEEAFLEDNLERTRLMPYKPSTLLDFLAGRPLELEPIWGEPLRRARGHRVACPQLAALYAELVEKASRASRN